ncbi:Trace amine-associated receptor 1 [Orchesella cincta]|uniref:Trace amine-associated receptor 1 n=1 Tax=Orchesella cincta TaxID=48709 RepID=A0A1D2MEE3_ORCCI|nr:Trace amine-associated receptor 1 [Orchesella cincta]
MMITVLFFIPNRHQILSDDMQSGIFFFGMSNSLFNPLIYGIFHLWKPRRKELQRGISSRRTLLTNLSFERRRSSNGTILNGSIGNNNRLGNGATVHGKHGSLLTTTHSTAGTISMAGGGTLKKHCLDENHHDSHNHRNLQQQPHHHLNVMPSAGGVGFISFFQEARGLTANRIPQPVAFASVVIRMVMVP